MIIIFKKTSNSKTHEHIHSLVITSNIQVLNGDILAVHVLITARIKLNVRCAIF